MRNGTKYAKQVKRLFAQLKHRGGKPEVPEPTEPLDQLIVSILAADAPESKAALAAKQLRQAMVDVNEVRVSTNAEVVAVIKPHVADSSARAAALRNALNAIFRKENAVDLGRLHKMGRRDARQYLLYLDGVDAYAAASVMLWSLGGHAIPVNGRLFAALRKDEMVDPSASVEEVQAFLERNVPADDAREFCILMEKYASTRAPRPSRPAAAKSGGGAKKSKKPATLKTRKKATIAGAKRSRKSKKQGVA